MHVIWKKNKKTPKSRCGSVPQVNTSLIHRCECKIIQITFQQMEYIRIGSSASLMIIELQQMINVLSLYILL